MWIVPRHLARLVRAIAGNDLGIFDPGGAVSDMPILSPWVQRWLLVGYYVGVLIALVLMYGINAPVVPPFIYQGF